MNHRAIHLGFYRALLLLGLVGSLLLEASAPPRVHGQGSIPLTEAITSGKLEVTRLTGRSPGFFEPMILLEARNRSGADLTVDAPSGLILKATDGRSCDVVILRPADLIYFSTTTQDVLPFLLFGYCLQLAPRVVQFPSNQATYQISNEMAPLALQEVLGRIEKQDRETSFAAQLAIWMKHHDFPTLEALQQASGAADLSGFTIAVGKLIDAAPDPTPTPSFTPPATASATAPAPLPPTDLPTAVPTTIAVVAAITTTVAPTAAPATPTTSPTATTTQTVGPGGATIGATASPPAPPQSPAGPPTWLVPSLVSLFGIIALIGVTVFAIRKILGATPSSADPTNHNPTVPPVSPSQVPPTPAGKPDDVRDSRKRIYTESAPTGPLRPVTAPPADPPPAAPAVAGPTPGAVTPASAPRVEPAPADARRAAPGATTPPGRVPPATPDAAPTPHVDAAAPNVTRKVVVPAEPTVTAPEPPVAPAPSGSGPAPKAGPTATPPDRLVSETAAIARPPAAPPVAPVQVEPRYVELREVQSGELFRVPAEGGVLSRAGSGMIKFVVVPEQGVSIPHAMIEAASSSDLPPSEAYWIKDLRSPGGTLINDIRSEDRTLLRDGDRIQVGTACLRFRTSPARLVNERTKREDPLTGTNRWLLSGREVAFITLDRLNDRMISAPHAYVEMLPDGVVVRDLRSTNGTLLAGVPIVQSGLVPDDILQLGQTQFQVNTNLDYMPQVIETGDEHLTKVDRIASGGMALLYRYYRERGRSYVAVKVPRLGKYRQAGKLGLDYRRAFENEISYSREIAAHPLRPEGAYFAYAERVVRVNILYTNDAVDCLVMDYIDGMSLDRIISTVPINSTAHVVEISWRIVNGLAFLHERLRLVHCDVKPANILVDRKGNVVLTDLGIAGRIGDPLGPFMSPGYWPPEATTNIDRRMTPQLDIFSFGVTLYEIITRNRLLSLPPHEWSARAAEDAAVFPGNPTLATIAAKCLAVDPDGRYRSISEVAGLLQPLREPWQVDLTELVDRAAVALDPPKRH